MIKLQHTILFLCLLLSSCGFHLRGPITLAPPLHRLYLQTPDPYGTLATNLKQYLKMSHVTLVNSPQEADVILSILRDEAVQIFRSVSGTQQTRYYDLVVYVTFELTDAKGVSITGPQGLAESRGLTMQSNQILGNSNEVNLFYHQMRRTIASNIMNRIASKDITLLIMNTFHPPTKAKLKR